MIRKLNLHFTALVLILLGFNVPYWSSNLWPEHGTLVAFINFYSFYNEFFWYHDLMGWIPYGAYGVPAVFWQVASISPVSYGLMVIGKVFQITDALFLFKMKVLLEQLVFLSGMYRLANYLFRSRLTTFLVCFGSIASVVWLYEISWNLRIFYLLPFALLSFIRFFSERQSNYFWKTLIVLSVSTIGNLPYFAPLHALLFLIFGIILTIEYRCNPFRLIMTNLIKDKFMIAVFLFVLIPMMYLILHMFDGVAVFKAGRNSSSLFSTDIQFFLTDAFATWSDYLEFVFASLGRQKDNTKYIGLLPWFFITYSFFSVKDLIKGKHWLAFVLTIIFLIFFSAGHLSPVAGWMFHIFPPVRVFHYLEQTGSLIRILFFILSGFGCDLFLGAVRKKSGEFQTKNKKWQFWISAFVTVLLVGCVHILNHSGVYFAKTWPNFYFISLSFLIAGLIVTGFVRNYRCRILILVFIFIADLVFFQWLVFNKLKVANQHHLSKSVRSVYRYPFSDWRYEFVRQAKDERARETVLFTTQNDGLWLEGYDFAKYDPCIPSRPAVCEASSMAKATELLFDIKAPLGTYLASMPEFTSHVAFSRFLGAISCGLPKVRLMSNAILVRNQDDAKQAMLHEVDFSTTPVILGTPDLNVFRLKSKAEDIHESFVKVNKFNSNGLEADVAVKSPNGEWLYYADAFHKGWHAVVDGKEVSVMQANIAFKSILVPPGKHKIEFKFFNGLTSWVSYYIAFLGLAFFAYWVRFLAPLFRSIKID